MKAIKILAPKEGEKILDLCSGTGRSVSWIAQAVGEEGEGIGMDISKQMVEVAKNRYDRLTNIMILQKDATQTWGYENFLMEFSLHLLFMNFPKESGVGLLNNPIRP